MFTIVEVESPHYLAQLKLNADVVFVNLYILKGIFLKGKYTKRTNKEDTVRKI